MARTENSGRGQWGTLLSCALALLLLAMPATSSAAAYASCKVTFKNVARAYSRCATLDAAGKFKLAWTFNKKKGTTELLFTGQPEAAYGWAGWGISPTGKMANSDVIVGYGNPKSTTQSKVRQYWIGDVKGQQIYTDTSIGLLSLAKGSAAVEVAKGGKTIRILSTATNLQIGGSKKVIWRGGPAMSNFNTGKLSTHAKVKYASIDIDFTK